MSMATADNAWVNTADSHEPAVIARARQILTETIYATLSTCSPSSTPWASPVFFTYDDQWRLYWSSAIAARHSQNLADNQGRAAIAIYSTDRAEGKGQGLYLSGTAGELEPERVEAIMQRLFERAGGDPPQRIAQDYLGASPRRMYCFVPDEVWITGTRIPIGNQLVDTKIKLSLADLQHSQSR